MYVEVLIVIVTVTMIVMYVIVGRCIVKIEDSMYS